MNVLVACEESQEVCKAFRAKGHRAFSCDIQPCSGGHSEWHIQGDVIKLLKRSEYGCGFYTELGEGVFVDHWDMIIAFPPCTYLTVTGNRWFNIERYGEKAVKRLKDREDAIKFFMFFANANCDRIAIENPIGIMSTAYRKPDQIIQPYMFGMPFEKKNVLMVEKFTETFPDK